MVACLPRDVLVAPRVADGATAGEPVIVSLAMSLTADRACLWTVSTATVVLKVQARKGTGVASGLKEGESGDVWSTQVCDTAIPASDVTLQPAQELVVDVTWQPFPGPAPGEDHQYCPGTSQWLVPGGYTASAAALGGEPSSAEFRLRRAVAVLSDDLPQ